MKERGRYWKHVSSDKPLNPVNFTFDLFIQALHIIATYGFEKMKDDLASRMILLFKHIYEIMNGNDFENDEGNVSKSTKNKSRSPGSQSRYKDKQNDFDDNKRKVCKNSSDIFITSNRSGASTKSSRARKNNSQNRKSKHKRRSSNKKRSRRYANDNLLFNERNVAHSINNSNLSSSNPFKINKRLKESSLPALTAIYGSSLENYKNQNRRNNSGLAAIDLSNQRKRKFNIEKVYNTVDVKNYGKNNSLSLVVPSTIAKNFQDPLVGK